MTSAEGGAPGAGGDGGVQTTLFTQEQLNSAAANSKREAIKSFFTGLGFDSVPDADTVKSVFTDAGEFKKIKDGEKGDVQRLTDDLNAEKQKVEKIPGLEATIHLQKLASDAGLPSKFWKFIEGKTDDEITESIADLKKDLNLDTDDSGDGGADEGQAGGGTINGGTGKPPAQNQQQGRNNGGGTPKKTLSAGRDYYEKQNPKKE